MKQLERTIQQTCVLTLHYKQELSAGGTTHGKKDVKRVKKRCEKATKQAQKNNNKIIQQIFKRGNSLYSILEEQRAVGWWMSGLKGMMMMLVWLLLGLFLFLM